MKTEEINHEKCIVKIRAQIMKANPDIEYIRFDLSDITSWTDDKKDKYKKTGHRIWVGYKNKKREEKTFIGHDYCPYCGGKY